MSLAFLDDLRSLLDHHAPVLAHLDAVSEAIDSDTLMQAVQGATDLTAGQRQMYADMINRENAEMARAIAEATENGRAAGVASVTQADPPPAEAEAAPDTAA